MRNFTLYFLFSALLIFGTTMLSAQTSVDIDVSGLDFTPSQVTISVGDTVHWFNTGGFHNVNGTTSAYPDNPEPFGNALGFDWTYSHVFDIPGTYNYHCDQHVGAGMTGVVIVEDISTAVQEIESNLLNHVFPVPATEYVILELTDDAVAKHPDLRVKLFDQLGREQSSESIGQSNRVKMDVSDLRFGIYFYQLVDGESVLHTGKMVVQ